jgi:hypothetical protein
MVRLSTGVYATPENCGRLADTGEQLALFLEGWGLRVPRRGALRSAIAQLRKIAKAGAYGTSQSDRESAADALAQLSDWNEIVSVLGEEPVESIASELAIAVAKGIVAAEAAEIRTQFWFGSVLALSGLRPAVPPKDRSGKRPDFVIQADGIDITVEVKRPHTIESAVRAADRAAGQIDDFGKPGCVVLDLSRALGCDELRAKFYHADIHPREALKEKFIDRADIIFRRIEGQRAKGPFARVLGLYSYARASMWHHSHPSLPAKTVTVQLDPLPLACAGLLQDTEKNVRRLIRSGMQSMVPTPFLDLP